MIADLHSHYPMHLLAEDVTPTATYERMTDRKRPRWVDRLRVRVLRLAAELANYKDKSSGWRVTFDGLEQGRVGMVLSVLYEPFAEMDLDRLPRAAPEDGYFDDLVEHLERVEARLLEHDPKRQRHDVVRTAEELDAVVASGRMAFVHCVEGGFHLGNTPEKIEANVAELARRGVGYITLAHLFYRRVATNTPALPFLPDVVYKVVFSQPCRKGLTQLGEAAVRAMYEQRILIDLSHMRADAVRDTFALLHELDAESGADPTDYPVISSHAGYRFGGQDYMHDRETIEQIARRDGVIGLILARHQLQDGRKDGDDLAHTVATITAHAEKIREITGTDRHVGIGTDLDGFIKPTMAGVESAADLGALQDALREAYPEHADALLHENAVRVVRRGLAQRSRL